MHCRDAEAVDLTAASACQINCFISSYHGCGSGRFHIHFHQNIFLLEAIPPTIAKAADLAFRFRIPGSYPSHQVRSGLPPSLSWYQIINFLDMVGIIVIKTAILSRLGYTMGLKLWWRESSETT